MELGAQCQKELNIYEHFQLKTKADTINYSIYSKNGINSVSKILLFVQGSGNFPFYEVEKINNGTVTNSTMPFDLEQIPNEYAFVLISKKGIPFCTNKEEEFETPKIFFTTEGLNYRANRISQVINHLATKQIKNTKKIVVIGHSEGADVVAKLGTINNKITDIGYWSGGGNTQFYDFTIFVRKEVINGNLSEEQGLNKIESVFTKLKEIMNDPESINNFWEDNSYRRWAYFSEPPIDNLLKIKIPLFVAIGSKDKAVPIESTYLIPIEFIRKKKENLTFKVYPNLDHGFELELQNDEFEDHWPEVFNDFLNWIEKNSME